MQALFYMELRGGASEALLDLFREHYLPDEGDVVPLFEALVAGVCSHMEALDARIESFSSNWRLSRMAAVDRNVMRIAVYEMLFVADIPAKVSINEAIDIGKKFGTRESGGFINGILDSVRMDQEKHA